MARFSFNKDFGANGGISLLAADHGYRGLKRKFLAF